MDPQAAMNELLEAVGERDWDRVEKLADGLLQWLKNQGFPPQTIGGESLGRNWHRTIAEFVCYMAQAKVREARKRRERRQGG
jgi:hypothetical protein